MAFLTQPGNSSSYVFFHRRDLVKIEATVLEKTKGPKKIVFKMKRRKGYRRWKGKFHIPSDNFICAEFTRISVFFFLQVCLQCISWEDRRMVDTIVHLCFVSVLCSVPLCRCSVQLENAENVLNVMRTLVTCSLVAHEHFFFWRGGLGGYTTV